MATTSAPAAGDATRDSAAAMDLTQKVAPFLDLHLLLQVLDHLQEKNVHPKQDILRARLALLKPTKMIDYMLEQYRELHQAEPPAELSGRRDEVVAEIKRLGSACGRLHAMLQPGDGEAEATRLIEADEFNRETLREDYEVSDDNIDALYAYAKCRMDCGDYAQARRALDLFTRLLPAEDGRRMSATWGLLAASLLDGEESQALAQARALQGMIERANATTPALVQLQRRSWLLHWSLFFAFTGDAGRTFFVDLCFHRENAHGSYGRDRDRGNEFMAALQNNCPWLIRYLAVAVLTSGAKTRRTTLKPLVRAAALVAHEHRDPVTDFVTALHESADFAAAGEALQRAAPLLASDFFLSLGQGVADDFVDSARLSVAETYCRVHSRVALKVVADTLRLPEEEAAAVVDEALRQSKIDGEVDAEKGEVAVNVHYPTLADVVHDRMKEIEMRTERLKTTVGGASD